MTNGFDHRGIGSLLAPLGKCGKKLDLRRQRQAGDLGNDRLHIDRVGQLAHQAGGDRLEPGAILPQRRDDDVGGIRFVRHHEAAQGRRANRGRVLAVV